jgi:3-deoxy-D-manno-octulosonic-acid transferase
MRWIYTSIIYIYVLLIRLAALSGNHKARLWVRGRKNLLSIYSMHFSNEDEGRFIWFHVSSLGEFEQGRPVIEALREKFPHKKILLTFFSPSGYEIRKNYEHAHVVLYLPFDSLSIMRNLTDVIRPSVVVFVKYDFWFNLMTACKEKNIPLIFISAVFRKHQYFFSWWASWFKKQLRDADMFFVQTAESADILKNHNIPQTVFAGDTRIDRVINMSEENRHFPEIEPLISGKKVLIAGSTWPADEKFIIPWVKEHTDTFLIIAPHKVTESRLSHIESALAEPVVRLSQLLKTKSFNGRIVLIDSIGVLAYFYRYAHVVYIGNGFGRGIHNILEPVVFGKPVIFGPNYRKFTEANVLVREQGAFSFSNRHQFVKIINQLFDDEGFYRNASEVCKSYVSKNRGATTLITNYLTTVLKNYEMH